MSQAAGWYDHPFAGVLLTPGATVSSIGMPGWSGIDQGLHYPDRIVTVEGVPLVQQRGRYPAALFDEIVEGAYRLGEKSVHVRVATQNGERELDLKVGRLDAASWWLYGGVPIFTGALYAIAAVIAIGSSPRGPLARAFAKFATLASLFFLTFFEGHTTRTMVPLNYVAFAGVPFALATLVMRLPDDAWLIGRFPGLARALDAAWLVLATVIVTRDLSGAPVGELTSICTALLGLSLITFVFTLGLRYARAQGSRRATLGVVFRATATPYVLMGVGILIARLSARGTNAAFIAMPATALAPLATGVAFARHDLWGSRALLSRVLTRALVGGIAAALAAGAGAALAASMGTPFLGALVAAAAGAAMSAPLAYFAARSVEQRFFPAAAEYKPTIEQLSEELLSIKDPAEVARAVERTVRRWLPCERVEFRPVEGDSAPRVSREGDSRCIESSFAGRTLAHLVVGKKRGGALFTTDDMDLLGTIANQAGLALAHAHSYAELERQRQHQVAAWQIERAALVETVAAEIAHEVRYPINFFRSVFQRSPQSTALEAEEIDIGCEEIGRLERLVAGLRRMVGAHLERRRVSLGDIVDRVEILLRDALRGREIARDIPGDVAIRCDRDQVTQVLVNLVSNALDAAGATGQVGVQWTADGDEAGLIVWDDGPGFEGDASRLFVPWFTTKTRGTGLGLAITQRIVRAHGWRIDAARLHARTRFTVSIPASDVIDGGSADDDGASAPPAQEMGGIH
jgi:signal transduction histidine kinase